MTPEGKIFTVGELSPFPGTTAMFGTDLYCAFYDAENRTQWQTAYHALPEGGDVPRTALLFKDHGFIGGHSRVPPVSPKPDGEQPLLVIRYDY
jgi:hypothetical protein